ncbi:GntR family transcriptional regulator [Lactiplantibacillus paraplantarum]|uniref:GntR family transcriptional regulator n=1 Tax=Lactiplantibacillus paraplantarum TaxID=60520 RepID=A0AAD0TPV8_9LACO|nr:GntR family transcriptional regulator [Lactiplantibacillus paraplantarum]AVW10951.1 GntR family transcriptional regulator [Lactiplantibacillus paraplantarum]AYJ39357.1 GntR family transcriptional regulator [Lactiplantibacillus paraplantarum]ERL42790.1 transcription regulator [Lactiplantibacillus paraplantarum]KRL49786.1 transcription regulator [Lactiplantibacillus paraplantarum DSM 10667]MCU4684415.1 GntR family transcriptional regulator [Lactiplantibacillus paraplantarum]
MKFDDKVPIYYQIKQYIYHEMIDGTLPPGAKLPAVRQLALDLTVNVNTVQRALSEMITEGTLTSQRGKGNFVTTDQARITQLKTTLVTEQLTLAYNQLHALDLSDSEIVTSLQQYIAQREEHQHDSIND